MLRALSRWKFLFLILSGLLVIGLIVSRVISPGSPGGEAAVTITAEEAADHIGTRAEVCGEVEEVTHATWIGGEPTFINFGDEHPEQSFTAVIWGDDRPTWHPSPEQQYANQEICVTGRLRLHEGTPQIVVASPDQIVAQPGN